MSRHGSPGLSLGNGPERTITEKDNNLHGRFQLTTQANTRLA